MDVFEHAMQMETDGREFYLEHAEKVQVPELKKILLELADDELKHYNIFKAMRDRQAAEYKESEASTILVSVKNVFQQLRDEKRQLDFGAEAKTCWEEARDVERRAEEHYRKLANEQDDENQKNILNRIADEEHRHWVTMENVIQFIDRPSQWLADAEWSQLDEG